MDSNKGSSIRETNPDGNKVAIIDLHDNNSVVRKPMSAESAIMNPSQMIIALRAQGGTLQVCEHCFLLDDDSRKTLNANDMYHVIFIDFQP